MKGNEKKKKEQKKAKAGGTISKVQSDYQKDKGRLSVADPIVFKPKK